MTLFETPGADHAYDKLFNPPRMHEDTCNCAECHAYHDFWDLAEDPDFACCASELAFRINRGDWCEAKPRAHGDAHMDLGQPGRCLECEHESKCKEEDHIKCL